MRTLPRTKIMDNIKNTFEQIKVAVIGIVKKYVIKKFFNGALSGVKGFFTKVLLKYVNKKVIKPSVNYLKRKYRKFINKHSRLGKGQKIPVVFLSANLPYLCKL